MRFVRFFEIFTRYRMWWIFKKLLLSKTRIKNINKKESVAVSVILLICDDGTGISEIRTSYEGSNFAPIFKYKTSPNIKKSGTN